MSHLFYNPSETLEISYDTDTKEPLTVRVWCQALMLYVHADIQMSGAAFFSAIQNEILEYEAKKAEAKVDNYDEFEELRLKAVK